MVADVPAIRMLKEAAPRTGTIERDEFAAILRHLPTFAQPAAQFAYECGWRIQSEILPMEWHQVDLQHGIVHLPGGITKTGKARDLHLWPPLQRLLEQQRALTDRLQREQKKVIPLVFHHDGERISRFDRLWKSATTAAGVPWTIPHDMRRSAARNLVRDGLTEGVAMAITGHLTRSVFDDYNVTKERDLVNAAKQLGSTRMASAG